MNNATIWFYDYAQSVLAEYPARRLLVDEDFAGFVHREI